MYSKQIISGFSKYNKQAKLELIASRFDNPDLIIDELKSYWHEDAALQKLFDEFSENTITNFFFPMGVVPNVNINGHHHVVPMVIEESSVVAAASNSAKFWADKGGFHAQVLSTTKIGQVHFIWQGDTEIGRASCRERV